MIDLQYTNDRVDSVCLTSVCDTFTKQRWQHADYLDRKQSRKNLFYNLGDFMIFLIWQMEQLSGFF